MNGYERLILTAPVPRTSAQTSRGSASSRPCPPPLILSSIRWGWRGGVVAWAAPVSSGSSSPGAAPRCVPGFPSRGRGRERGYDHGHGRRSPASSCSIGRIWASAHARGTPATVGYEVGSGNESGRANGHSCARSSAPRRSAGEQRSGGRRTSSWLGQGAGRGLALSERWCPADCCLAIMNQTAWRCRMEKYSRRRALRARRPRRDDGCSISARRVGKRGAVPHPLSAARRDVAAKMRRDGALYRGAQDRSRGGQRGGVVPGEVIVVSWGGSRARVSDLEGAQGQIAEGRGQRCITERQRRTRGVHFGALGSP